VKTQPISGKPRSLLWGASPILSLILLLSGATGLQAAGALAATTEVRPGFIDVRSRGAVADGSELNTILFNRLIGEISAAGGGTLWFPAGTYLTGTINLRSHVTLQLEPGARILGSTEISDYPENPPPRPTDRLEYGRHALIHADGQTDVAIVGQGTINGQGSHSNFTKKDLQARGWSPRDAYLKRPYGLSFVRCQRVRVEGIRLENIAFWCQHYLDCDDVVVRGVTVESKKYDYNNDGIDIDGSRNVRVNDCHFNVGDDAICLKAAYRDCENIIVTNCTASSLANGVKFGTASAGGFKNITISNIVLDGIQAAGIALEIVDGGTLDGVILSNFTMRNVGAAIFIRLGDFARRWVSGAPKLGIGILRNVSISNIVAEQGSADLRPLSSSITGLPGYPVENISISDVRITSTRSHPREASRVDFRQVPEVPKAYPEYTMFGALPAHGLYARHVRGLTLRNVQFAFTGEDYRSAVVCDDVERLVIDGLQTRVLPESAPVLLFHDVRGASVVNSMLWEPTADFLQLHGASTGIELSGNRVGGASVPALGK
jgi:polygalacturonase